MVTNETLEIEFESNAAVHSFCSAVFSDIYVIKHSYTLQFIDVLQVFPVCISSPNRFFKFCFGPSATLLQ